MAKKAVFISDSNHFGQGSRAARLIKLVLYKTRLWGIYNYLNTHFQPDEKVVASRGSLRSRH